MDNKQHGILDTLKHLAFEDEPEKPATPSDHAHAAAPAPALVNNGLSSVPAQHVSVSAMDPVVSPDSDTVYQRLVSKTDFESTEAAATIRKFLEPLAAIPDTVMPPNVKFRTAVLQAKAQSGLSEDSILASFDAMHAQLQQEQDAFASKAKQFEAREIAAKQERINQITSQITQLQQELSQLSVGLVDAQGKASHAQAQFNAAVQRRTMEIEQQKAHYAALLKG